MKYHIYDSWEKDFLKQNNLLNSSNNESSWSNHKQAGIFSLKTVRYMLKQCRQRYSSTRAQINIMSTNEIHFIL